MDIVDNFRVVDQFDVSEIKSIISRLDKEWYDKTDRQENYSHHAETVSVTISDIDINWTGTGYPIQRFNVNDRLTFLTQQIIDQLEYKLGGKVGKALYIKLPAGKDVGAHYDMGHYLESVHRCHIPILTNDNVIFHVGGENKNLKEGVCYEINNTVIHAVRNAGSTDRIHLLIDIIPEKEFMRDWC